MHTIGYGLVYASGDQQYFCKTYVLKKVRAIFEMSYTDICSRWKCRKGILDSHSHASVMTSSNKWKWLNIDFKNLLNSQTVFLTYYSPIENIQQRNKISDEAVTLTWMSTFSINVRAIHVTWPVLNNSNVFACQKNKSSLQYHWLILPINWSQVTWRKQRMGVNNNYFELG